MHRREFVTYVCTTVGSIAVASEAKAARRHRRCRQRSTAAPHCVEHESSHDVGEATDGPPIIRDEHESPQLARTLGLPENTVFLSKTYTWSRTRQLFTTAGDLVLEFSDRSITVVQYIRSSDSVTRVRWIFSGKIKSFEHYNGQLTEDWFAWKLRVRDASEGTLDYRDFNHKVPCRQPSIPIDRSATNRPNYYSDVAGAHFAVLGTSWWYRCG